MKNYTNTDQRLHVICQTLAKANRNWVPSKEDDSHTNLYFDSLDNRIAGRWIDISEGQILLSFNLKSFQFEIINNKHRVVEHISVEGKTVAEIEEEMESQLVNLGLDGSGFRDPLHYEIPDYPFSKDPITLINSDDIQEWSYYRELANTVCFKALGHTQRASEVRIWPHHFDSGIYFENSDIGIGMGLAMEDSMAGAPYFYMSGYPKSGALGYENLPKSENWKWKVTESWSGVVFPLKEVLGEKELKNQIDSYLKENLNWFLNQ